MRGEEGGCGIQAAGADLADLRRGRRWIVQARTERCCWPEVGGPGGCLVCCLSAGWLQDALALEPAGWSGSGNGALAPDALARHGVGALLLEAELDLASGASGANSGILHTGFDSPPAELETRLILRAAVLRDQHVLPSVVIVVKKTDS